MISVAFKKGSPVVSGFVWVFLLFFLVVRCCNIQSQLTLGSNIISTPGSAIWFFLLCLILPTPHDVWELLLPTVEKQGQRG